MTTLVVGADAVAREAAIANALDPALTTAVIAEGLAAGAGALAAPALQQYPLHIVRIAAGCICCNGNLVMRVTLNRTLQRRPQRLFISLASDLHLPQIQTFLCQEPYDKLLSLTKECRVFSRSNT